MFAILERRQSESGKNTEFHREGQQLGQLKEAEQTGNLLFESSVFQY